MYDLLVLGSGVAGLTTALTAARRGMSVLVLTKTELANTATRYAQGGVAAAFAPPDSPELAAMPRPPVPRPIRKVIAPEGLKAAPAEPVEVKKFNRAYFAILVFIGLLLLIAGYTLKSNPLTFFGILSVIVGGLCIVHDWSPLPPRPPRTI